MLTTIAPATTPGHLEPAPDVEGGWGDLEQDAKEEAAYATEMTETEYRAFYARVAGRTDEYSRLLLRFLLAPTN